MTPLRFSISAAFGAKALAGSAAVALAAGLAGAVTTGSVNPANWGQHVAEVVEQCRAADANVGKCVSAIAQEHGEQVRAQHSEAVENGASSSPKPGQREGQESGQSSKGGNGVSASQDHGQGQAHDTTPATPAGHGDHGQSKPSPHP